MTDLPDAPPPPDVQAAFAPLADLPCWNVRVGYAAGLTLHFGEPRLKIWELPYHRKRGLRRSIHVYGQWHLWLDMCDWFVLRNGERRGSSLTKDGHERAVRYLSGRKLESVHINTLPGRSMFTFEDGVKLCTRPYRRSEKDDEQWLLFEPSGMYCRSTKAAT